MQEVLEKPKVQRPMKQEDSAKAIRFPVIGNWVYYWQIGNNPVPAQVIMLAKQTGYVHLNIHGLGYLTHQLDVPYSEQPKIGCWSWPEQ